jgi:hypothetical protein
MEPAREWSLLDEIEEDAPITEDAAQRVRAHASAGCLICAFEAAESEWDDE